MESEYLRPGRRTVRCGPAQGGRFGCARKFGGCPENRGQLDQGTQRGGALPQMMRAFNFGVGGRIGSGQQWVSWIALQDAVSVIREALQNRAFSGAVNVVSPQPERNVDFARALGRVMHRPAIMPVPAF